PGERHRAAYSGERLDYTDGMASSMSNPQASTRGNTAAGTCSTLAKITNKIDPSTAATANNGRRPVLSTKNVANRAPSSPTADIPPVVRNARVCSKPASIKNVGNHWSDT